MPHHDLLTIGAALTIENPKMRWVTIDGEMYGVLWQDRGDHRHLKIFKGSRLMGFKNQGLAVDTGYGVVRWVVRAMHKGIKFNNEFNRTKT
jgi:hypothetical protein